MAAALRTALVVALLAAVASGCAASPTGPTADGTAAAAPTADDTAAARTAARALLAA